MIRKIVYLLNGPNLNLLGSREPEIYGRDTLAAINARLEAQAERLGVTLVARQSNHEGDLIDWLHDAQTEQAQAVILNPAGYSHTSVALLDAVKSISVPVIEVHLSDPEIREAFRRVDLIAAAARAVIKGEGSAGYAKALDLAACLGEPS